MATLNWEKVGRAIADSAPVLGSVLGGPAGGAVGTIIASTLGTSADPDAVMEKLKADPDALMKIKQLEKEERAELRNWQLEILKTELADTQNARAHHSTHWMPAALTVFLTCMVCAIAYWVVFHKIPYENKDMAVYIFGVVTGAWSTAVAYWIGTSRTSFVKDQVIAQVGQRN